MVEALSEAEKPFQYALNTRSKLLVFIQGPSAGTTNGNRREAIYVSRARFMGTHL
jgi:hypothetical protein